MKHLLSATRIPQSDPAQTMRASRFAAGFRNLVALAVGVAGGVAQAQTLVATIPSGPSPIQVAVNETSNMIYVADNNVKTLTAINGATNTATTIAAGGTLAGVAVNPTTNTVYALNGGSQSSGLSGTVITPGFVTVINGATNAVTATVQLPGLATYIAANPATNKVYVTTLSGPVGNGVTSNVVVLDGSTNSITATVSMPALISHIGVDTARNVIYTLYSPVAGNFNQSTIAAINGATNTVAATIAVGINDTFFALNGTTNTIYVPDAHFEVMYVISGATMTIASTIAWPDSLNGFGMAVNPVTNTIYVPSSNGSSSLVDVMNGSTNSITTSIPVPTQTVLGAGGLLVNSVTNKIWRASSPVLVIDGATNAVTSVTGTSGAASVTLYEALNTATNYAYAAEANDVLAISGVSAGPAFSASPSPLAFGSQTQGTTSSAMLLTVTNSGTANLTLTTVTPGGTNSADFIVTADNCASATVAANSSCTVSVEFAPTTTSSETATLSFADNASGSPQIVTLTGTGVAPVPTPSTTKLTASSTSISVGTSVTFTATVTPASGTPTPTGTVTFKDGANTLGTGTLNGSGVATYTTTSLAAASHSITATYAGDSRNTGSASTALTVSVTLGSTTTALTASATSIAVGSSITFTATVTGTSGVPAPTGMVTFSNGSSMLSSVAVNSSGVATYTTSALATGSQSIVASYAGDTNNAASVSAALSVMVWPGPPAFTISLSPSNGSFKAGSPAAVTITVASVNGFNSATSLACSGLPQNATCSFSPTSITPAVAGMATSTLTIATDVKANVEVPKSLTSRSTPMGRPIEIGGGLVAFLLFPFLRARNRKLSRFLLATSSAIVIAGIALLGMSGCGGSGPTTPTGTYSVQVTATAGALTQNATYSLTVQ